MFKQLLLCNPELYFRLVEIERKLDSIMVDLTNLRNAVQNEQTVEKGAVTLLQGLSAQIKELAAKDTVDPSDLTALADQINQNASDLALAVTQNTPASPGIQPSPLAQ